MRAVLLVAPHTSMGCDPAVVGNVVSCGAPLEAWRPLHEDPATGIGTVFEGCVVPISCTLSAADSVALLVGEYAIALVVYTHMQWRNMRIYC